MWNFLGPRNLIHLQQMAAIKQLDREIAELQAQGYTVEVDRLLDRRLELMRSLLGPIA